MMRDPSPPLWESSQNIRGGCYSFRYPKKDAHDIYLNYIIAAMLGSITSPDNRINGITISPKRGFNIIKLWNTDAQKFNNTSDIDSNLLSREGDIIYTPFIIGYCLSDNYDCVILISSCYKRLYRNLCHFDRAL